MIGFIGLGNMGKPMVRNLLEVGFEVKVFDVVPEAISELESYGAIAAESVQDAVKDADVVFTMVQTGDQVHDICLGKEGIFSILGSDAIYIDCSSIDIKMCRKLHEEAQNRKISMVDAPVSGGVAGAEAASLTIMVGGSSKNFQKAASYLEHLSARLVHTGDATSGQAAKMCNNMMLGIQMISVAEGFTLAKKLGLAPEKLFEVASHASSQCWSLTSYCPVPGMVDGVPANNDYKPGFTAQMMLKDLHLSQDAARSNSVATPLGAEATELYTLFNNQGHEDMDFSAIIQLLEGK